jgi:acyl transferase domain-containing protein/acyl-CoA synthetase (AMP-forming)/AMP-acid ligase II/acyl carrier protein
LPHAPVSIPTDIRTLVALLRWRAQVHPERTAYIFLDRGVESGRLTFGALFEQASAVAVRLRSLGLEGKRALRLYPSGQDYVVAFWGCLLAGVVAVPAYPPHNQRTLKRLLAIIKDAEAGAVLTSSSLLLLLRARLLTSPSLWALKWQATDKVPASLAAKWEAPAVGAEAIAFLQYTSGSTSTPKGVQVTHDNLMHNAGMIESAFELTPESVAVCWVPLYHDLGLIGHMLQAAYTGFPCVIMSPLDFLADPALWLEAISRYKGTHGGAPNFAFDLCVRKTSPERRSALDLSHWVLASNCAEPVRADTLDRFTETFAPQGFKRTAFRPTYGLAEVTLLGTIAPLGAEPGVAVVDKQALRRNQAVPVAAEMPEAVRLVGCGRAWGEQRVRVVDPETRTACADGTVGEVWISGRNVASGYWRNPEATEATFGARLSGEAGAFMRTGDLGFFRGGELFITGRLKDMIILRGQNVYPQDIERSAEEAHPKVRPGCVAAFAVDVADEERLVAVAEVARDFDRAGAGEVLAAVRQAIAEQHGVAPYAVALLKAGTVPKTSSGKIQRSAARVAFLDGKLDEWARYAATEAEYQAWEEPAAIAPAPVVSEGPIETTLRGHLSELLGVAPEGVDLGLSASAMGLDSLQVIELKRRMETALGIEIAAEAWMGDQSLRELVTAGPWIEQTVPATGAPVTGTSDVAEVWKEVLGTAPGLDDNFFDLGATSLMAVQVAARLQARLGVDVPVVKVFEHPTVRALAAWLAGENQGRVVRSIRKPRALRAETGIADVAIVGMSLRVPGASGVDDFWENLVHGREARREFTDAELRAAGVSDALLADSRYVKAGAVLEDIDKFDAGFFGYSPREAEILDPQQRLFLEAAWGALEDAGHAPGRGESVGVFAGAGANQYFAFHLASRPDLLASVGDFQLNLANDKDYLATRAAYKLNLTGPALTVQTACSTSLVAVHLACESLKRGECDMAIAGGVSVHVRQEQGYLHMEGGVLSPDGRCRPFDAQAQGTPFSSGVGVVALKRLEDAIRDGDTIHAVIKGTAINNDGAGKVGFTAPSVEGQAQVIQAALSASGIAPETIGYVEAHGTATALGDPIEVAALTRAYRAQSDTVGTCAIGSVKSNLGHLDAAAGVVGLIKATLAVKHGVVPPSLHYEQPNPHLALADSPFFVAQALTPWPLTEGPRRAGVSAFGLGGTNAHAVLEAYEPVEAEHALSAPEVLILSAKTEAGLEAATERLLAHLKRHRDTLDLADVAYTLQVGRPAFRHRRMLVVRDVEDAILALESRDPARVLTSTAAEVSPSLVLMFPGQGAQYPGMGRGLYETEPVFRAALDRCAALLQPHLGLDLREVLFGDTGDLYKPSLAQPALLAVSYAMAALWLEAGLKPAAMIGHSVGEYAAACLAGACRLEDALALVSARGKLFEQIHGAMLAVTLSEAELAPYLAPGVALSSVNGPRLCVAAGTEEAVAALQVRLEAEGVHCRKLPLPHAAHCELVEPMMGGLEAIAATFAWQAPRLPYLSNVTGTWITEEEVTNPHYWARHLRQPVRFAAGLDALYGLPNPLLVEAGPGQALTTFARQHPARDAERPALASMRHPQDPGHDRAHFLAALGRAWLWGADVNWNRTQPSPRRRVPLPTYPFARDRHWLSPLPGGGEDDFFAGKVRRGGPWVAAESPPHPPQSGPPQPHRGEGNVAIN